MIRHRKTKTAEAVFPREIDMSKGKMRSDECLRNDDTKPTCCLVISDDELIKEMLVRAGAVDERPPPQSETSVVFMRGIGYDWMVVHFWCPSDPGYIAFGIPQHVPKADKVEAFDAILLKSLGKVTLKKAAPPSSN